MARVFIFVMDSVGTAGAPDASAYRDEGADTLGHIADACATGCAEAGRSGPLRLPHLDALGLGAAARESTGGLPEGLTGGAGCWAVGRETSRGKDTPSGHWELAGTPVPFAWHYFPKTVPAFPEELMHRFIQAADIPGILGNCISAPQRSVAGRLSAAGLI